MLALLVASWLLVAVLVVALYRAHRLAQRALNQLHRLTRVERGMHRTSALVVALIDAHARAANHQPPLSLLERIPPWERSEP